MLWQIRYVDGLWPKFSIGSTFGSTFGPAQFIISQDTGFQKQLLEEELESLLGELQAKGLLSVNGAKLTYSVPSEQSHTQQK